MGIPVWMDVDTGIDDAIALMVLHALPELDVVALSAVCGNSPLSCSYRNTRSMNTILGTRYPVYAGAEKPLLREARHASAVHGENGLGDVEVELPADEVLCEEPMWDALYAEAVQQKGQLRLIATGPLTNVAIALTKYPDLKDHLHTILIMGGATQGGNTTPSAEFNIYADPEAASIVFKAGVPIVMCPLDVTERILLTPDEWKATAANGAKTGQFLCDILEKPWSFHKPYGRAGVQMHDSVPVIYLAHPELFDTEEAGVVVETKGTVTLGKTVTDLYSDKQFDFKNATVVLDADIDAVKRIILNSIGQAS